MQADSQCLKKCFCQRAIECITSRLGFGPSQKGLIFCPKFLHVVICYQNHVLYLLIGFFEFILKIKWKSWAPWILKIKQPWYKNNQIIFSECIAWFVIGQENKEKERENKKKRNQVKDSCQSRQVWQIWNLGGKWHFQQTTRILLVASRSQESKPWSVSQIWNEKNVWNFCRGL